MATLLINSFHSIDFDDRKSSHSSSYPEFEDDCGSMQSTSGEGDKDDDEVTAPGPAPKQTKGTANVAPEQHIRRRHSLTHQHAQLQPVRRRGSLFHRTGNDLDMDTHRSGHTSRFAEPTAQHGEKQSQHLVRRRRSLFHQTGNEQNMDAHTSGHMSRFAQQANELDNTGGFQRRQQTVCRHGSLSHRKRDELDMDAHLSGHMSRFASESQGEEDDCKMPASSGTWTPPRSRVGSLEDEHEVFQKALETETRRKTSMTHAALDFNDHVSTHTSPYANDDEDYSSPDEDEDGFGMDDSEEHSGGPRRLRDFGASFESLLHDRTEDTAIDTVELQNSSNDHIHAVELEASLTDDILASLDLAPEEEDCTSPTHHNTTATSTEIIQTQGEQNLAASSNHSFREKLARVRKSSMMGLKKATSKIRFRRRTSYHA